MAPPARGSSSGAAAAAAAADAADGGGFAAATAALRQCIAGHYREGPAAGQRAVAAAVQQHLGPLLQRGDSLLAGEAVELAFRQVLSEDLVARALAAKEDILDEGQFGVRALLDLALGLVAPPPPPGGRQQQQQQQEQEDAAFDCPGKRTPFSLLEDVFEVLGVAQVEAFWPVVEEREAALFDLFPFSNKNKLAMLKICNALLRRLSKSHNTAICGRLMMYLSRNWDLSEPSALNKTGQANVANQTVYEDGEEFERQQVRLAEKQRREEELRLAVAGGQEQAALQGGQKQQKQQEAPIDYSLYQSFWGLQERLSEPAKLLQGEEGWADFVAAARTVLQAFEGFTVSEDSVSAAAAAATTTAAAPSKLKRAASSASLGSAGASVGGDEAGGEQPAEEQEGEEEAPEEEGEGEGEDGGAGKSKKKRSRTAMEGAAGGGGEGEGEGEESGGAYLGCKYLTNSRLFRLQLHDPLVRVQVLTQVLIVLNYVQASLARTAAAAAAATTPAGSPTAASAAAAAAAAAVAAKKLSAGAAPFVPGGAAAAAAAAAAKSSSSSLAPPPVAAAVPSKPGATELKSHARRLIRATPQHGAGYLKALDAVLDRERQWLAWKQVERCASKIERPLPPTADGGAAAVRARPDVKAALAAAAAPTAVVKQQRAAFYGHPLSLPRPVHAETIAKGIQEAVDVTFASYVLPRVEEANDPENCIDEEFHPRHDAVFCWRALRLAASANPKALVDLETGSLDALCERAAGLKPPPPQPARPAAMEEEEEEAEQEAEEVDGVMMAVGNGSGKGNGKGEEQEKEKEKATLVKPEAAAAATAEGETEPSGNGSGGGGGGGGGDEDSAVAYVAAMEVEVEVEVDEDVPAAPPTPKK